MATYTLSKSFNFSNGLQGWVNSSGDTLLYWSQNDGNPAGCMTIGSNNASNSSDFEYQASYTATWEDLGVPAGATVTNIRLDSGYDRSSYYSPPQVVGGYYVFSNGGKIANLKDGRQANDSESTFVPVGRQPDQQVTGNLGISSTQIQLVIGAKLGYYSAHNDYDEITYVITYVSGDPRPPTPDPPTPTVKNLITSMFISGFIPPTKYTGSKSLFVRGKSSISSNRTLFTTGYVKPIGITYSSNLSISGIINVNAINSNSPLVIINNYQRVSYGMSMMIEQDDKGFDNTNNPLKLFIAGPTVFGDSSRLFIAGQSGYVVGKSYFSQSLLFLNAGKRYYEDVGLFLKGQQAYKISDSLPISMYGSQVGYPTIRSKIPLIIIGDKFSESMNLVIQGSDSGGTSKIIRIIINGDNLKSGQQTPLYLENLGREIVGPDMELFIQGDGLNPDYIPHNHSLGLYIENGPQPGLIIYIINRIVNNSAPMIIRGSASQLTTNYLPVYTRGFGDTLTQSPALFIEGEIFKGNYTTTNLVIPQVTEFVPAVAYLYTNGFQY